MFQVTTVYLFVLPPNIGMFRTTVSFYSRRKARMAENI
jgi:hypothetical protein